LASGILAKPTRVKNPNVTFHYTPTRGQSLAGASFTSVEQLREHIDAFVEAYNKTAEPSPLPPFLRWDF
jgi:hypothetical protein